MNKCSCRAISLLTRRQLPDEPQKKRNIKGPVGALDVRTCPDPSSILVPPPTRRCSDIRWRKMQRALRDSRSTTLAIPRPPETMSSAEKSDPHLGAFFLKDRPPSTVAETRRPATVSWSGAGRDLCMKSNNKPVHVAARPPHSPPPFPRHPPPSNTTPAMFLEKCVLVDFVLLNV